MMSFFVDTSEIGTIYKGHIRPLAVSPSAILDMADPLGLFLFAGAHP